MSPPSDARTNRGAAGTPSLRLIHVAVFFSSFDRLVIATDLGVSLTDVAAVATIYHVGYGLMQVVWGIVSDRLGRVRTMRLALLVAGVASLATAFAPGLAALLGVRLVAGGAYAAIVPGALIYVGDTVPVARRHGPLTDVMMVTAIGMSAATLLGAGIADLLGWRLAFALPGALVLGVAALMGRLPEPATRLRRQGAVRNLATVLRHGWALVVLAFAFVEGAVLLAVLNYLPTTLQSVGMGTTLSGVVTAVYGVAIILFSRAVKVLSRRWSATRLIGVGGGMGVGAYVALVADPATVGVLVASVLVAGAWAFMHSTMQKWATEVTPDHRATTVSLFACALFVGSAVGTAFGAGYVERGDYATYFTVGLGVAAALAGTAVLMRSRYPE